MCQDQGSCLFALVFVLFSVLFLCLRFIIRGLVGFSLIVLMSVTCVWFSHLRLIVSAPPPSLYKLHLPASLCQSMTWWCDVCAGCVCVGLLVSQFLVLTWPLILGHVCVQIIILSRVFSWKTHCHSNLNRTVFANHHTYHKIWFWKHTWIEASAVWQWLK